MKRSDSTDNLTKALAAKNPLPTPSRGGGLLHGLLTALSYAASVPGKAYAFDKRVEHRHNVDMEMQGTKAFGSEQDKRKEGVSKTGTRLMPKT